MAQFGNSNPENSPTSVPPGISLRARKVVNRIFAPVERFLSIEESSGIVLVIATGVALAWANSPRFRTGPEHIGIRQKAGEL
jgi:hypothetical protein